MWAPMLDAIFVGAANMTTNFECYGTTLCSMGKILRKNLCMKVVPSSRSTAGLGVKPNEAVVYKSSILR